MIGTKLARIDPKHEDALANRAAVAERVRQR
jgi:hypothetical protein